MEDLNSLPPQDPISKGMSWSLKILIIFYVLIMVYLGITNWGQSSNWELGWLIIGPILGISVAIYAVLISVLSLGSRKFKDIEYAVLFGYLANYFFSFAIGNVYSFAYYVSNPSAFLGVIFISFFNFGEILFVVYFIFLGIEIYKKHRLSQPTKPFWTRGVVIIILHILFGVFLYTASAYSYAIYQNKIIDQNLKDTEQVRKGEAMYKQQLADECKTGTYIRGHIYINDQPWRGGLYLISVDGQKSLRQASNGYSKFEAGLFDFSAELGKTYNLTPIYTNKIISNVDYDVVKGTINGEPVSTQYSNTAKVIVDHQGCITTDLSIKGDDLKITSLGSISMITTTGNSTLQPQTCSNITPTSWKNYKNNILNFSVDYPITHTYQVDNNVSNSQTQLINFYQSSCNKLSFRIDTVINNYNTVEEYWKNSYGGKETGREIMINGQPVFQIKFDNGQIFTSFFRKSDKEIFNVSLWDINQLNSYNVMLDSFKF